MHISHDDTQERTSNHSRHVLNASSMYLFRIPASINWYTALDVSSSDSAQQGMKSGDPDKPAAKIHTQMTAE